MLSLPRIASTHSASALSVSFYGDCGFLEIAEEIDDVDDLDFDRNAGTVVAVPDQQGRLGIVVVTVRLSSGMMFSLNSSQIM